MSERPDPAVQLGAPERPAARRTAWRSLTVRAFAARFLTERVDRRLKPNSRLKYRDYLRHVLERFGDTIYSP